MLSEFGNMKSRKMIKVVCLTREEGIQHPVTIWTFTRFRLSMCHLINRTKGIIMITFRELSLLSTADRRWQPLADWYLSDTAIGILVNRRGENSD